MKVEIISPQVYGPKGNKPLPLGIHDLDDKTAERLIKRGMAKKPGEGKEFVVNPALDAKKVIEEYKQSDEFKTLLKSQDDDEIAQLRRLHEEIVGTKAHPRSGAEKIADDILDALEPDE